MSDESIAKELAVLTHAVQASAEKVERIDAALFGNGKPETALLTRVSDLEKVNRHIAKAAWLAVAALIALASTGVWKTLTG